MELAEGFELPNRLMIFTTKIAYPLMSEKPDI